MFIFKKSQLLFVSLLALWLAVNYVGITYGTWQVPLHQGYIGDEQSPINGALHILEDRSLLAVRNLSTLYYGPVFALLAVPAVGLDFVFKSLFGITSGAQGYVDNLLFDWGGVMIWARVIATIFGFLGLWFVYLLFRTKAFNLNQKKWWPWLVPLFLATNYYYYQYNHFFKHWVFVVTAMLGGIYAAIRLDEIDIRRQRYVFWLLTIGCFWLAFGVSYISVIYFVFWLPLIYKWLVDRDKDKLFELAVAAMVALIGAGVIIAWHPYAFLRLLEGRAFVVMEREVNSWFYYIRLIGENHLPILIALIISLAAAIKSRVMRHNDWLILVALLLPAVINFLVFGAQARAEGRYMLPTIVLLHLILFFLLARVWSIIGRHRIVKIAIIIMLIFSLAVHLVHIIGWNYLYSQGPAEQKMIQELIVYQSNDPNKKVLVIQDYIIGHLHAKNSYQDYIDKFAKQDVNLYQQILATDPPDQQSAIAVDYFIPIERRAGNREDTMFLNTFYRDLPSVPWSDLARDYDRIILKFMTRVEPNNFDYIDENFFRLWYYNDLMPKYLLIK